MALSDKEQAALDQRIKNIEAAVDQRLNGTIKDVLDRLDALEVGGGQVDVDALAAKVADQIAARLKD